MGLRKELGRHNLRMETVENNGLVGVFEAGTTGFRYVCQRTDGLRAEGI